MTAQEIKEEIKTLLEKLDLVDKQKVQSSKLSGRNHNAVLLSMINNILLRLKGGMKRKVCLGIAFCAGSSVVIAGN